MLYMHTQSSLELKLLFRSQCSCTVFIRSHCTYSKKMEMAKNSVYMITTSVYFYYITFCSVKNMAIFIELQNRKLLYISYNFWL